LGAARLKKSELGPIREKAFLLIWTRRGQQKHPKGIGSGLYEGSNSEKSKNAIFQKITVF
jgi:hypothetical protein